jgi:hypothetical protein
MRNIFRHRRRKTAAVTAAPVHIAYGRLGPVAVRNSSGDGWIVTSPPSLKFTGVTATGAQLRAWAKANSITAEFAIDPDMRFAQIESQSGIAAIIWLKRFNQDTGYTYVSESRDCDNFARRARAFADMFASPVDAQACNLGIYSEMPFPFAGVADAVHALNVAWTDQGVYVYEPQGLDLIYQRLEDWPNKRGISSVLPD